MAQRLRDRSGTRSPRPRTRDDLAGEGYLFPGEVAEMLGCQKIDYHQLRRLFRLVRAQAAAPVRERKWARFTLKDIAALRIALDLCGGVPALEEGRRLAITPLERACEALRGQGVGNPLLDVPMTRQGTVVFAEINGLLFDPVNGQLTLKDSRDLVERYLDGQLDQLDAQAARLERGGAAPAGRERRELTKRLAGEASARSRARDAARGRGVIRIG